MTCSPNVPGPMTDDEIRRLELEQERRWRSDRRWTTALAIGLILVILPVVFYAWTSEGFTRNTDQALVGPLLLAVPSWPPGCLIVIGYVWRSIVHGMDRFMDDHP